MTSHSERPVATNSVKVHLKGLFNRSLPDEVAVPAGQTVAQMADSLAISSAAFIAVLGSGKLAAHDYVLEPGDEILLVELVDGG